MVAFAGFGEGQVEMNFTRRSAMRLGVAGATVGRPLPDPGWSKVTSRATQRRRTLDELVAWNRWPD